MTILYGELASAQPTRPGGLVSLSALGAPAAIPKPSLELRGGPLLLSDSPEQFKSTAQLPAVMYRDRVTGDFRVFYHRTIGRCRAFRCAHEWPTGVVSLCDPKARVVVQQPETSRNADPHPPANDSAWGSPGPQDLLSIRFSRVGDAMDDTIESAGAFRRPFAI